MHGKVESSQVKELLFQAETKGQKLSTVSNRGMGGGIRNGRTLELINKEDTCLEMTLKSGLTVPYREVSCAKKLEELALSTGLTVFKLPDTKRSFQSNECSHFWLGEGGRKEKELTS